MSDIRDSIIDRQRVPERGAQEAHLEPGDILPAGSVLLLKREKPEEITEGGIIIPDRHKRQRIECAVMAKGPDCTEFFKVGDRVMTSKYGEITFNVGSEQYMLMYENQVLCKLGEHVVLGTSEEDVEL